MGDLIFVREDDGTERAVTDEVEAAGLMASGRISDVETVGDGTMRRVFPNVSEEAERRAEGDASDAAMRELHDRTVVVTVDDGVMPATVREVELQGTATEAHRASVKARVAKQEGVTQAQVLIETLDEHQARTASE